MLSGSSVECARMLEFLHTVQFEFGEWGPCPGCWVLRAMMSAWGGEG